MINRKSISGLTVFQIEELNNRQILLGDYHHLLRRFGQLELVTINQKQHIEYRQRRMADEIIFIDRGQVSIHLVDVRAASPTFGVEITMLLDEDSLGGILVPFGLAYSLSSKDGAKLICLSTHNDDDDKVRLISAIDVKQIVNTK